MMAPHTPGPLIVSAVRARMDGQQWLRITTEDGHELAYVPFGDRTAAEYAQCTSDARLYAAAPDMHQALTAALPVLEAVQKHYAKTAAERGMGGDGPLLEAIRAALAKAEGRTDR